MAILMTYASKHGSTKEIAERVAGTLRRLGSDVEILPVDAVGDPAAYEAVVIGSAVYYGAWRKEATAFVHHNTKALAERPTWLFSSGPTGTDVKATEAPPKRLAELMASIKPRDHQVFYGALAHDRLSFAERMLCKALRATSGDFRNWAAIDTWAEGIARALAPLKTAQRLAGAASI